VRMSQMTEHLGQSQGQTQEVVGQAAQKAKETTHQAMGQARGMMRDQIDRRSSDAGQQVTSVADTIRSTGDTMRQQGNHSQADMADRLASQVDRVGTYLRDQDADRLLQDVEDFGRRQPWTIALLGFVGGMAAARFLKASSERRYQAGIDSGRYTYPSYTYPTSYDRPGYARPGYERPGYASPGTEFADPDRPVTGAGGITPGRLAADEDTTPGRASDTPLGGPSTPASI